MKISRLVINNFKGIKHIDLRDLADTVVIAGQNGCGKSSVFDALRLWKSAYGGYVQNEIHNWYNENGLSFGNSSLNKTLQNKNEPMVIYAELALADDEKVWLQENAEAVLRTAAYRRRAPEYALEWKNFGEVTLADNLRVHSSVVDQEVSRELPLFTKDLHLDVIPGCLTCYPDGRVETEQSILLSRTFSIYDPSHIGKFDYHGPQRTFGRETVGGINLQIEQYENQRQQSALYNASAKYNSVKGELASAYVRDIISKQHAGASGTTKEEVSLVDTVKEMFDRFFPGKKFLGVTPNSNGSLSFDVETAAGSHDLNELSSGEKELIYGYLRLKNESPRNSIIMLVFTA